MNNSGGTLAIYRIDDIFCIAFPISYEKLESEAAMFKAIFKAVVREMCSGHEWTSWQGVDAHPSYRKYHSGLITGDTDWRINPYPCEEFRHCTNCGTVENRHIGHLWGSARSVTQRQFDSEGYSARDVGRQVQDCLRSGCTAKNYLN